MRNIIISLVTLGLGLPAYAKDPPLTWSQASDDEVLKAGGVTSAAPAISGDLVSPEVLSQIQADMAKSQIQPKPRPASSTPPTTAVKPQVAPVATVAPIVSEKPEEAAGASRAIESLPQSNAPKPTFDPFAPTIPTPTAGATRAPSEDAPSAKNLLEASAPRAGSTNEVSNKDNKGTEIEITDSQRPSRGVNVRHEMPSVRHVTMSPGNKYFGGDDVEIAISPIFDIVMQMPDAVEWFTPSSDSLVVSKVPNQPSMLKLKLKPINNPVPMSLQVVDVNQKIWTFTVVGVKADLATEYPKTLIINKKTVKKTIIGARNPASIINALPLEYAIQMVVGDAPNTSEMKIEMLGATYMHHEGYATYMFGVSKKDGSQFEKSSNGAPNLKFTLWANGRRMDGGGLKSQPETEETVGGLTRDVEWTVDTSTLSKSASRKSGKETYIVICQVRASILDLEDWNSAFITVSDSSGYTRFDFQPYSREFRAPNTYQQSRDE